MLDWGRAPSFPVRLSRLLPVRLKLRVERCSIAWLLLLWLLSSSLKDGLPSASTNSRIFPFLVVCETPAPFLESFDNFPHAMQLPSNQDVVLRTSPGSTKRLTLSPCFAGVPGAMPWKAVRSDGAPISFAGHSM